MASRLVIIAQKTMPLKKYIKEIEADAARDDGPAFAEAGPSGAKAETQPMYLFSRQFLSQNERLNRKLAAVRTFHSYSLRACDDLRVYCLRFLTRSTASTAYWSTGGTPATVDRQMACNSSLAGRVLVLHSIGIIQRSTPWLTDGKDGFCCRRGGPSMRRRRLSPTSKTTARWPTDHGPHSSWSRKLEIWFLCHMRGRTKRSTSRPVLAWPTRHGPSEPTSMASFCGDGALGHSERWFNVGMYKQYIATALSATASLRKHCRSTRHNKTNHVATGRDSPSASRFLDERCDCDVVNPGVVAHA